MHVRPFTLNECERYYQKRQFHLSHYEMVLAYMALGGMVEIKYSESVYAKDADYELNMRNKLDAFVHSEQHRPAHSVNLVMLTTFGLSQGIHNGLVDTSLTMDVLFRE